MKRAFVYILSWMITIICSVMLIPLSYTLFRLGGLSTGLATAIGFRIGDGLTTSMQTPVFTSISPVIWGNTVGGGATEGANWIIEKLT